MTVSPRVQVEKRAKFLSIMLAKLCDKLRFGAEDRDTVLAFFQSKPVGRVPQPTRSSLRESLLPKLS